MKKLKIGLPKGSLEKSTVAIFKKAGFNINIRERSYFPSIDDEELEGVLVRAQEISRYVEAGVLDCGITGNDWILENASKVHSVADLVYAKQGMKPVRWVVAVPQDSKIRSVRDLNGGLIATELVRTTKRYLAKNKVKAEVEFSWGATEAKVVSGLVDGIVELTETGSSLRANGLKIVDTVCLSTTQLIANRSAWKDSWKRQKIENISLLLKGAIAAEEKVGLKMNCSRRNAEALIALLPAIRKPTLSTLAQRDWFAIETIIDETKVRELIPKLKSAGAEGIIEYPLNKVVY